MKIISILLLGTYFAGVPDQATRESIAIIRKAKGSVTMDEKAPGRPVVGVNL